MCWDNLARESCLDCVYQRRRVYLNGLLNCSVDQEHGSRTWFEQVKLLCFLSGGFTWEVGAGSYSRIPRCLRMNVLQAAVETGKGTLVVLF